MNNFKIFKEGLSNKLNGVQSALLKTVQRKSARPDVGGDKLLEPGEGADVSVSPTYSGAD